MRRFKTMLWALPLSLALTGEQGGRAVHARDARALPEVHAKGEYRVRASLGARGGQLVLKNGVSVRPHLRTQQALPIVLELRVAEQRAVADQVAFGFVPIGPTVVLDHALAESDVSFLAESFRVREAHRLVLAVESAGACGRASCWELWDAEYRDGRCRAAAVATRGLRLQFGSVPAQP